MIGIGKCRPGFQWLCPGAGTPGAGRALCATPVIRRMPDGSLLGKVSPTQPFLPITLAAAQGWSLGILGQATLLTCLLAACLLLLRATLLIVAMVILQRPFGWEPSLPENLPSGVICMVLYLFFSSLFFFVGAGVFLTDTSKFFYNKHMWFLEQ